VGRKQSIRNDYRRDNYKRIDNKYKVISLQTKKTPDFCKRLDNLIQELRLIIEAEAKKQIQEDNRPSKRSTIERGEYLTILRDVLKARELEFLNSSCEAIIENEKLLETRDIATAEFEKYDADVFQASDKISMNYFIIGGVVMICAVAIIFISQRKK